jgi:hypothetical protein
MPNIISTDIIINTETYLDRISLGPVIVFQMDRFSVYEVKLTKTSILGLY